MLRRAKPAPSLRSGSCEDPQATGWRHYASRRSRESAAATFKIGVDKDVTGGRGHEECRQVLAADVVKVVGDLERRQWRRPFGIQFRECGDQKHHHRDSTPRRPAPTSMSAWKRKANLIGNDKDKAQSAIVFSSDHFGTPASPIDPMLGPLQDNGGLTKTRAPLAGQQGDRSGHASGCPRISRLDHRGRAKTPAERKAPLTDAHLAKIPDAIDATPNANGPLHHRPERDRPGLLSRAPLPVTQAEAFFGGRQPASRPIIAR